jgi:hypothetical protein
MRMALFAAAILLGLLASPPLVQAQPRGRISASSTCDQSEIHQSVTVEDGKQHSISLDKRPCRWDKAIEIGGSPSMVSTSYGVDDVQNNESRDEGYVVGVLSNGDNYFLCYVGTATMRDGAPVHLEGTWKFTGGTGALQRLRGKGAYHGPAECGRRNGLHH